MRSPQRPRERHGFRVARSIQPESSSSGTADVISCQTLWSLPSALWSAGRMIGQSLGSTARRGVRGWVSFSPYHMAFPAPTHSDECLPGYIPSSLRNGSYRGSKQSFRAEEYAP